MYPHQHLGLTQVRSTGYSGPYRSRFDASNVGYACGYMGWKNVCLVLVSLTYTMPFRHQIERTVLAHGKYGVYHSKFAVWLTAK